MNHFSCPLFLLLAVPLAAQSPFLASRHATLPYIPVGDKYAAADLDADGDVDLVVANDNAPAQLLLNDGRGAFVDATAGRLVNPTLNAAHSVDLVDVDGDGDIDILIGHDDFYSNQVYLNNGAAVFTDVTVTALPPNAEFTQNQVVADFDGDGDVDWLTVDAPGYHLYDNNGVGVFTDISATHLHGLSSAGERWQVTALAADLDGDGDLDACVPTYGAPYLIENRGGHLYPAPVQPPAGGSNNHTMVDIDGDGDVDIVSSSPASLLQNQGNWTFVNVTSTTFGTSPGSIFTVIDADADGDPDLLGYSSMWWNNGAGLFTQQVVTNSFTPFSRRAPAAIADFDDDGDLDFAGRPNFQRQVAAASAPMRGASYSVDFHTAPGTTTAVVALAALGGAAPNPFGSFGSLRLDAATAIVLSVQSVSAGVMTLTYPIPAAASLAGVQLHYQALMTDPRLGARFTNAIGDTLQ